MILRFNYLIIMAFLSGCGRYSESEINSLKMVNGTFNEIISSCMEKNIRIIDDLENVVYENGGKPSELKVLENVNSINYIYKESINKISLLNNENNTSRR